MAQQTKSSALNRDTCLDLNDDPQKLRHFGFTYSRSCVAVFNSLHNNSEHDQCLQSRVCYAFTHRFCRVLEFPRYLSRSRLKESLLRNALLIYCALSSALLWITFIFPWKLQPSCKSNDNVQNVYYWLKSLLLSTFLWLLDGFRYLKFQE